MQSRKKAVDSETQAFQRDLPRSVKEMNAGKAANKTKVRVPPVVSARHASGLSQAQFASVLGISVRTLQKGEQGEREPPDTTPAKNHPRCRAARWHRHRSPAPAHAPL